MTTVIAQPLTERIEKALYVAIALAKPGSPMHAQIMATAHAFDDAVNDAPDLSWAAEVHPAKTREGAARIDITWEQWNSLRRACGLKEQPEPRNPTIGN